MTRRQLELRHTRGEETTTDIGDTPVRVERIAVPTTTAVLLIGHVPVGHIPSGQALDFCVQVRDHLAEDWKDQETVKIIIVPERPGESPHIALYEIVDMPLGENSD